MIASISGTVIDVRIDSVVISVGGVGMHIFCAPNDIAGLRVGEDASLFTSLIVREESLTLYGFANAESRELFEIVQSVSGFGPKLAFTIIATFKPDDLRTAIGSGDIARLTKTPGVGSKGAQRLILELKDKIGYAPGQPHLQGQSSEWADQVTQALVGLGWSNRDATSAIDRLTEDEVANSADVAFILRRALQILAN